MRLATFTHEQCLSGVQQLSMSAYPSEESHGYKQALFFNNIPDHFRLIWTISIKLYWVYEDTEPLPMCP